MRFITAVAVTILALPTHASVWETMRKGQIQTSRGTVVDVDPTDYNVIATIQTKDFTGQTITLRGPFCVEQGSLKTDAWLAIQTHGYKELLEKARVSKETVEFTAQGPWSFCFTSVRLPAS